MADFSAELFGGFSGRFCLESSAHVLKNLLKPCKQRACEIFSTKSSRNSRTQKKSSCLWVHCCSLGAPSQTLQILGVAGRHATMSMLRLGSAPPRTGSPGPFGPGTPEESEKSPEEVSRGGTPRVPKEWAPESQKSPKRV